jgi:uncharacterized damage-inducible protein DinB
MPERALLLDELRRAVLGDAWHGPAFGELLGDVTAAEAAARPVAGAHGVWEIVLHVTAWAGEVRRRLGGGVPSLPAEGDWPPVPAEGGGAEWERARRDVEAAHDALLDAVAAFPEERLGEAVTTERSASLGTGVTFAAMLHGVAQHLAYHGGQVALLKRALRPGA